MEGKLAMFVWVVHCLAKLLGKSFWASISFEQVDSNRLKKITVSLKGLTAYLPISLEVIIALIEVLNLLNLNSYVHK